VEDLAVSGLARTRLAKSVHDAGWATFTAMLTYKAQRYGRVFGRVDRWAPTSQMCSACGDRGSKKELSVREWACTVCGAVHDRHVNAALNILAAGLADKSNACGAPVSLPTLAARSVEAGTRRGAA
jgi:putative transposase